MAYQEEVVQTLQRALESANVSNMDAKLFAYAHASPATEGLVTLIRHLDLASLKLRICKF